MCDELWLRSSLVGWVVLQVCFVGWIGLGPLAILGWVGSQNMDPRPCLVWTPREFQTVGAAAQNALAANDIVAGCC